MMKYRLNIVGLIGLLCLPFLGIAQTSGIIYQATILQAQEVHMPGDDLKFNRLISRETALRFSIIDASGDVTFIEEHQTKTNAFGEVKLVVGSGVQTLGEFRRIEWDGSAKQLKVEIDYGNGAGYEYSNTQNIYYLPHPLSRIDREQIEMNRELLRFIIAGSGLDPEGNYISNSGLPILSDALSLADADDILANAIKNNTKKLDNYSDNQEFLHLSLSDTLLRVVVEANDSLTLNLAALKDGIGTDDQSTSEVYFEKPLEWQMQNRLVINILETAILQLNRDVDTLSKNESDAQKIWLEDASLRITNNEFSVLLSKYLNHTDHQNANQVFLSSPLDTDSDGSSETTIEEALIALVNRLFKGCTNPLACNYFSLARENDNSCVFPTGCATCSGETNGTGTVVENYKDDCGVCNGDNSSCADCAGVPNGTSWESDCGCVAQGNSGDDCDDCAGVPNGTSWESDCGCVAQGNSGDDCDDCAGVPNGTSWESDCGCVAQGNSGDDCDDCAGVPNGTSWESDCGCVAQGNSGDDCDDCAGVPNGTSWESDCGCVAQGNSGDDCDDCAGVPNGTSWESDCGCVAQGNSGDDCDDCAG
ncbi:MAG: hypothetical protein P8I82_01150, partial [Flavobacteriales bacterium]|nr:hypothetical protein [Flavobacteriales bacterium]